MAKITMTSNTNYIEDPVSIHVEGYNASTDYIEITAFKNYGPGENEGAGLCKIARIPAINFSVTCPYYDETNNYGLYFVYTNSIWTNIATVYVEISLWRPNVGKLAYQWKTMYIKPDPPTFNETPYYVSEYEFFSGWNKNIIRGLDYINIFHLEGTARKEATLKTIKINDFIFDYNTVINEGFNAPPGIIYIDPSYLQKTYLDVSLVDSRGFTNTIRLADISKFKYSYQTPRITEYSVERDGVSETTTLTLKGYYSEGYSVGKNILTTGYYYTENESGATEQTGTTTLTITKNKTYNFENFEDVLSEYNNPSYTTDDTGQYYTKSTFENNIKSLFDTALMYNDKYTQEYLQADYDSTNERYYCISGGYNGNWKNFWDDVLNGIYNQIYGNNVYGTNVVGNEDGGNYEFEITETIKGDLQTGFSLDKSFDVKGFIRDELRPNPSNPNWIIMTNLVQQIVTLPTALPAIDIYKDKVALHDIYDDTIGGDIQLNGDVYVNGEKLPEQKSSIKLKLSTNKSFSSKNAQKLTLSLDTSKGSKLTLSDGGVKIGAGITHVYASGQVYFYTGANHADGKVCRIVKNSTTVSAFHCRTNLNYIHVGTSTIIPVEENDIIYLYCINDTTNASVIQNGSDNTFLNVIEL